MKLSSKIFMILAFSLWLLSVLAFFSSAMPTNAANYQSSTTAVGSTSNATVAKPLGTATGDLLIAAISFEKGSAVAITANGWTLIRRTDQSTNVGGACYGSMVQRTCLLKFRVSDWKIGARYKRP
jgi:hypothetical protein